jgi:GNAT superfamily N-acetyltransferase
VPAAAEVRELSAVQFIAALDSLTWIYAHAMGAPAGELPGRLAIMQRHAGYPGFRAVVAIPAEGLPEAAPERPPGSAGSSPASGITPAAAAGPAGFAYGFHGSAGQWWYEVVRASLAAERGTGPAGWWLGDCYEVAEVHVHPGHQGRGAGRAMMHRLAAGLTERTAVLSTPEGHTRAHRLYRSLGFGNLLPALSFPGASSSYAIMGAALPLPSTRPVADRSASPSRR